MYVNVEVARENEGENKAYVTDAEPDVIADVVVPGDPDDPQTDEEEELQDPNTYYNDVEPAPPFNLPEQGFDVTQLGDVIMSVRRQPGGFEAEYLVKIKILSFIFYLFFLLSFFFSSFFFFLFSSFFFLLYFLFSFFLSLLLSFFLTYLLVIGVL